MMSKNKEKLEESSKINHSEDVKKIISKKYGDICFSGDYIASKERTIIPTTVSLDIPLNGGIPDGGVYLVVGKPKSGKSSLLLQIAANAQKLGCHIYYLNIEHRFERKNLSTVHSLKTTPDVFTVIESTKEKILTAQDFLNIASDIIATHEKAVLIIDSISMLCAENEMGKDIGEASRPEGPKMFAQFCRKNASKIPLNRITVLGVLHQISNLSGYGSPVMEDSGIKCQYAMNGKFVVKGVTPWEEGSGEDKKKIGQIVTWYIAEQANGPPGDTVRAYLRYNYGYDSIFEIVVLGIDLGLITKKGAWFEYLPDENNPESLVKTQGQSKLYDYFKNNPEELNKLYVKVKEMSV